MPQECPPLGEMSKGAEEAEPPGVVQSDQASEEQPSEQLAEYAYRKQEGRAR
ncbi:hypothetical protein D3C87_1767730 [compost metagenome]